MKVVMDFVPNHSSDEHDWFIRSAAQEEPYTDYYVWQDPSGFEDGVPIPPNNWLSIRDGSAWEYVESRGQFYYHCFSVHQPDLNYNNPAVLQEMKDVLIFWMDLGVDGFRFDAILYLWEDQLFLDEPPELSFSNDSSDYNSLNHTFTYNLPETRQILTEFYNTIKNYSSDRVSMLETYLSPEENAEYYACGDFPFNFAFVGIYYPVSASRVAQSITEWLDNLPEGRPANWVTIDNWRMGDRVGEERIDAFNVLSLALPGVIVTYNGDEIGMVGNFDITYEESVDEKGCNSGPDTYLLPTCSRDPERTPMQWSSEENAGFTDSGVTPWLPINDNYVTLNVNSQTQDQYSSLSFYKAMVLLRNSDLTFQFGATVTQVYGDDSVLGVGRLRSSYSPISYVTLVNFGNLTKMFSITDDFDPEASQGIIVFDTDGNAGSGLDLGNVSLGPHQSVVVQLI